MAEADETMKADLVEEIGSAWMELGSYLAGLSEAQVTSIVDGEGWTVKDHITHITAWEESVISFLQGRPRSEGLGVDKELYSRGSFDDINAAIREQRKGLSLEEATGRMHATHLRLLAVLDHLSDEDLVQPLRHFLPASSAEDHRRAIDLIRDNTSGHHMEHLSWIQTLVGPQD